MQRWIFIAVLSASLLAVPLLAQRGGHGGMGMGGGHSYAGAPHGGVYGGGGFHGGYTHGYPGHYPYYPGRYPYYGGRYPWGYRGFYGNGWYGYPWYGYPWVSLGWYGGAGWSGAYYSYPEQTYPNYVYAAPDNSNDNGAYDQQQAQIDQLNNEVDRLRAEEAGGSARNYVPQPPPKPEIRASTVLVFRDQHSEEIENYAIVGKTVWVFTEQRARKIPIAELNLPATTKANEARGIDFRLPTQ
jgi:hypothetical protein